MRRQVRDMFRFYVKNRGATILVTSHNLKELETHAQFMRPLSTDTPDLLGASAGAGLHVTALKLIWILLRSFR